MSEQLDRRSEVFHAICSVIEETGKMPSPKNFEKYLHTAHDFLTQDDIYYTENDNVIKFVQD